MNRKTRAEQRIEELDVSPAALIAALEKTVADRDEAVAARDEAVAKADEYLSALQRERAEFPTSSAGPTEERDRDAGLAGEDLIRKVLDLADDFDRAIANAPGEPRGRPLVRRHRRHRPQAAPAPRERGRDDRRGRRRACRSTRASTRPS